MDNQEMNRIIAEKVMGWHYHELRSDCVWLTGEHGNSVFKDASDYTPATNVAQAFEAAEVWRGNIENRHWRLDSPFHNMNGTVYTEFTAHFLWDMDKVCDASNVDPALAICEALVKAVSDE